MPEPLDTNDDWAELARELERDKPPAPPADRVERIIEAEAVEPHHGDPRAEDEAVADGEPEAAADEEFDDGDDAASGETGETSAEGEQPGTGRKRRRRRRRRRKGNGTPAEIAAAAIAESESDSGPEAEIEAEADTDADEEPAMERAESDDYAPTESAEGDGDPSPFGLEEDTASEVLRELIATWNVPSWEDIVGGLYRPN